MRDRYQARRLEAIERLGGKCARCGSKDDLQIDHKDANKKTMDFARMAAVGRKRFEAELKKCQLLCGDCHINKSREDLGQENAREVHGTLSSYRYCRCDLCRKANAVYHRERKTA